MAYSDKTMEAATTIGFPTSPPYAPTQGFRVSANVMGSAINYACWYDATIIYTFPVAVGTLGAGFYNASFSDVLCVPNRVVNDVTSWKIEKSANSWTTYLRMYDENGVMHYETYWNFDFSAYNKLTVGYYVDDDWSLNVYDDTRPLYLVLACDPSDPGWHFSVSWVTPPTSLAMEKYEFAQRVNYADNMGSASLSSSGYVTGSPNLTFDDYIDALYNGVYTNAGQLFPFGGAGGSSGGSFNRPDYEIGFPSTLGFSICDTQFISLYNCTDGQLKSFANYMWNGDFISTIKKWWGDPAQNIVSLQRVPMAPSLLSGVAHNIVIGNCDSLISSSKLTKQFYTVDCGRINVKEIYHNFADYHATVSLYLPYCGIVTLNIDDIMNHSNGSIWVKYQVDVFSGSCIAYVAANTNGVWHVLNSHAGNCNVQYPITGANYANTYIGAISAIASVGSGNIGGVVSGMMSSKPEYIRSGGVTGTAGMMGIQYPYLIFTSPNYIIAETFQDTKGYTSNLSIKVKDADGYLQAIADNSELSGLTCTAAEKDMIRNLFADGIYC